MATTRSFVAIAASQDVSAQTAQLIDILRTDVPGAKWVSTENLHWTLQFLGEVEDTTIPAVCDRVARGCRGHAPFTLEATGLGAFPSAERPKTWWLAARQGAEPMIALQASIEESLAEIGFRGEPRRFHPHLTLGRTGRGQNLSALGDLLATWSDFSAGSMDVSQVTVFGSLLSRQGPAYHVLGHARLGAA